MILNLSLTPTTTDQLTAGVIDLPPEEQAIARQLLTFEQLPSADDLSDRAEDLTELVTFSALFDDPTDSGNDGAPLGTTIMIDGPPFFMEPLAQALRGAGYRPVFSFPGGGFAETPVLESLSNLPVRDYATILYGSQRAFAEAQGVQPAQVTQWIKGGFIVVCGELYSSRRKLNPPNR